MNNINKILELFKLNVDSSMVKEPPTKVEIIDKLCTLGVDNPGYDNTIKVNKITKYVLNSITKYENYFNTRNREINLKFQNANNGGYRIINVHFDEDNIPGILESICVYIPVISSSLEKTVPYIYRHLLRNRISFSSKISFFNRSDNFIVTVYNKDDARSLINFCNNTENINENLGIVNPFIATLGKIGVSKELYGINYNHFIATLLNEYIEDCILKQRKKAYDAIDFQNFVNDKYKDSNNYVDKNMNYIVSASLYAILMKENVLKFFNNEISLNFDYDNYYRYEAVNLTGDYEYLYSGKVINKDTDYMCWVKLQALNCLNKIYLEQNNEPFKKNTKINQRFVYKLLDQLDNILNKKGNYNIKLNYNDLEIRKMIPYLYGFLAYKYKNCNKEEVKKLVDTINKILIVKKNTEKDKIIYEQNSQKIVSSIPIISTKNGSVAIDIIDLSKFMCNITILKKCKRENYLNVYLNLDYDLIRSSNDYNQKRYRYAVASALLDEARNKEALNKRKRDFSAVFLDSKEISKYLSFEKNNLVC